MKYSSLCKILIISIVVFPSLVVAMTSENYEISQDSINFSGSDSSTSTNYKLDDTMGEVGTGFMHSASYFTGIGYRRMLVVEPSISFTISDNSLNLGTLDVNSVSSASHSFTVTANATQGYGVKAYEDGDLRTAGGNTIDDVADGAVTAGSEEYGIGTSGTDGLFNTTDGAITDGMTLATSSTPVTAQETTVNYKVAIDGSTADGSYQHIIYYVISGIF